MKVGILGGTFDPVHSGHLFVARRIARLFEMDLVLFLIARRPPHKRSRSLASGYHRFAMVALATQEDDNLAPCEWELQRPAPTYTVEALRHFREQRPQWRVCFIAGSDSLKELHCWKDYARLLQEHCFAFVQRPGETVDLKELPLKAPLRERISLAQPASQPAIRPGNSFLVPLDPPDVSSTELRKTLSSGGRPGEDEMPAAALRYALKLRLYEQSQNSDQA